MKRYSILLLLAIPLAVAGATTSRVGSFLWQDRTLTLNEQTTSRGDTALLLCDGAANVTLSAPLGGENFLLRVASQPAGYIVLWHNFHQGVSRLALYESRTQATRVLAPTGFRSFPQVEPQLVDGLLSELYFLGERERTVDLFHLASDRHTLTRLTRSPQSVRGFSLSAGDEAVTLRCATRSETAEIEYLPSTRQVVSSERRSRPLAVTPLPPRAAPHPAWYYNTFLGFGDSIVWGQISGVPDPYHCFMNQIKLSLSPSWGEMEPINLGAPATTTYCGVWRITRGGELEGLQAKYFLLMYGFNDTRRFPWDGIEEWFPEPEPCPSEENPTPGPTRFCLAYSRENIEVMVDVAQERGMDVIASTLTPRKDEPFVSLDYYWQNLHDLSNAILEVAADRGAASVDTLSAFLNHNPPEGWKDLLEEPEIFEEDGEIVEVKGNHPNAAGHRLIADLFVAELGRIHAPEIAITASPQEAWNGEEAQFSAQTTAYEDTEIVRVEWTFSGDSRGETGATVSHRMVGANQTVTVTATAIDGKGRRSSASVDLLVKSLYPAIAQARKIHVRTVVYDRDAWRVSWTPDPRNASAGYKISEYWVYRSDELGQSTRIAKIAATAPAWHIDMAAPFDTAHRYQVVSVDSAGHTSPLPTVL